MITSKTIDQVSGPAIYDILEGGVTCPTIVISNSLNSSNPFYVPVRSGWSHDLNRKL